MGTAPENEIGLELARLSGIVKLHLALEDKNMYPRMIEHPDDAVRKTAAEYQRTMAALAPAYAAFHEKWIQTGAIAAARAEFIREFTAVGDALRTRIDQENRGLYDFIDNKGVLLAS